MRCILKGAVNGCLFFNPEIRKAHKSRPACKGAAFMLLYLKTIV
jgi:hypothetical protein